MYNYKLYIKKPLFLLHFKRCGFCFGFLAVKMPPLGVCGFQHLNMIIESKLKKWGNSVGVIIPSNALKEENLREGEEIVVEVKKKSSIKDLFGSLKEWKINAQKVKDEIRREEW